MKSFKMGSSERENSVDDFNKWFPVHPLPLPVEQNWLDHKEGGEKKRKNYAFMFSTAGLTPFSFPYLTLENHPVQ